ncbi:hypothetical protein NBRC116590_13720 [Pelagimonas sp. KU-00592-HH]|uniref:calcium-binding protein n=1 Tax=Pelagimonas sp. KU-00592-HH TaxID=3127651 RepID=UPI003106A73B
MATITETTDAATGFSTIYTLNVGDTFFGSVAGSDEVDRVLVDLTAGEEYTVTMTGLYGGTSAGVLLVANFDSGVTSWVLGYADGATSGQIGGLQVTDLGDGWRVVFTAPVTGQYSLVVDDNGDALAAAYQMSITGVLPPQPTPGDDVIQGTAGADVFSLLAGNDLFTDFGGDDTVSGNGGKDTLLGGGGNDLLLGGAGNDSLKGGGDEDDLRGGDGNDRLFGGSKDDKLLGGGGNDYVEGGAGDDTIRGNAGRDTLNGDAGDDRLFGDNGFDRLNGDAGKDLLSGGVGEDTLNGGRGHDTLVGGKDNDVLNGGNEGDILRGDAGADRLYGQKGKDRLDGGWGHDTLVGGDGADVFVIDGKGVDRINDMQIGKDTIDLSGFADGSVYSVADDGTGNTSLSVDGTLVAVLKGIDAGDLSDADFVLPAPLTSKITFDGGAVSGSTYTEAGFTGTVQTHAFQTVSQDPFQDLDGDGDLDFGVTDESDAVTNIDVFAAITFTKDDGDAFDFLGFTLVGEGGGDADGNLIFSGENDTTGYAATATFMAEGDGLWDLTIRPDFASGFNTNLQDVSEADMLGYFVDLDSLYIRSADGDGRLAVDTGNGIGVDDLIFG